MTTDADSALEVIQYTDTTGQHTVTLCRPHAIEHLAWLRERGLGCGATTAPHLFDCDACHNGHVIQP